MPDTQMRFVGVIDSRHRQSRGKGTELHTPSSLANVIPPMGQD